MYEIRYYTDRGNMVGCEGGHKNTQKEVSCPQCSALSNWSTRRKIILNGARDLGESLRAAANCAPVQFGDSPHGTTALPFNLIELMAQWYYADGDCLARGCLATQERWCRCGRMGRWSVSFFAQSLNDAHRQARARPRNAKRPFSLVLAHLPPNNVFVQSAHVQNPFLFCTSHTILNTVNTFEKAREVLQKAFQRPRHRDRYCYRASVTTSVPVPRSFNTLLPIWNRDLEKDRSRDRHRDREHRRHRRHRHRKKGRAETGTKTGTGIGKNSRGVKTSSVGGKVTESGYRIWTLHLWMTNWL